MKAKVPIVPPKIVMIPDQDLTEIKEHLKLIATRKEVEEGLKDFISADRACEMLDLGKATFYRLRDKGELRVYRLGGKSYLKLSELEEKLKDGLV